MRAPWRSIVLFIGPVMIFYGIFILYPIFATVFNSLHVLEPVFGGLRRRFVGFESYRVLLTEDVIFRGAVLNTVIWATVGPVIEMVTASVLAYFIFFRVPLYRLYRTAWFIPVLVQGVIVGVIFRWVFNNEWGIVNSVLRAIGLDGWTVNWLGRTDTALGVVIFTHFWNTFGYSMVLLLAGLSTVPDSVIESALIDGAGKATLATRILLPMIFPTFITTTMLSFMGKMRAFNVVWVLTKGGPLNASETVATYLHKRAFSWSTLDLGYPSAIAVVWFGVVLIGVNLLSRALQRRVQM